MIYALKTTLLIFTLAFQGQQGIILGPATQPVDPLIEYQIIEYLGQNPPAETHIYAITNVSTNENGLFVSLAGLRPDLPAPYTWSMVDGSVIWIGSLERVNGEWGEYIPPLPEISCTGNCSPHLGGPGGGPDIQFPWQSGAKMMYGILGIHGAGDYGFTGGYYVDWVGGDELGADVASPVVYASAAGAIDYICDDGTSVAVRLVGGDNTFVYAHLLDHPSLVVSASYTRGQPLGVLKYGSFNDSCGWASQKPTNYHLHWGFDPDGGYFQTEGWVLHFSDGIWRRGSEQVKKQQWMTGGGGAYNNAEYNDGDPLANPGDTFIVIDSSNPDALRFTGQHIWDYILAGLNRLFTQYVLNVFPVAAEDEDTETMWLAMENVLLTLLRDGNILLVNDVINLLPVIWTMSAILIWYGIVKAIILGVLVFRIIKLIPFL